MVQLMLSGGGFIAGPSRDSIPEETLVENVVAMFDTIQEAGIYLSELSSGVCRLSSVFRLPYSPG